MNPEMAVSALTAAREAAAAAADVIRHYWHRGVEVELKPDATPVTVADREAERAEDSLFWPTQIEADELKEQERARAEHDQAERRDGHGALQCNSPHTPTIYNLRQESIPQTSRSEKSVSKDTLHRRPAMRFAGSLVRLPTSFQPRLGEHPYNELPRARK